LLLTEKADLKMFKIEKEGICGSTVETSPPIIGFESHPPH